MLHSHPALFTDHHIQYPTQDLNLPFSDYLKICEKIIADNRVDLTPENKNLIINANTPFEFLPEEKTPKSAALLIHGLLDCPFIMRDIGKKLQQQGLLVRSVLLPGQGTVPGNLLNVTMEDWLQTAKYGVESFPKEIENIYLVGFSTGGGLALYGTLTNLFSRKISGLVLIAPSIKIRSHLDFATGCIPFILGKFSERARWLHVTEEIDYTHYQSIPFNAAYQVYRLSRLIKKLPNKPAPCPLFFILSLADSIVSSRASMRYLQKHFREDNRLLLYTTQSNINFPNTIFRSSVYSHLYIKHFSHVCLPIAMDNPHYGKNGDFKHASRVEESNGNTVFGSLNRFENKVFEWLYKADLIKKEYKRLTFNPDFEFMANEIAAFLQR